MNNSQRYIVLFGGQLQQRLIIDYGVYQWNHKRVEQIYEKADITPNTMIELHKDKFVAMPILERKYETFGNAYGEIMENTPKQESNAHDE